MFQPPAFPTETPESIEEHIKEKYLLPRLDEDAFSPEKAGKQWDFDWFARAKIPLEPSMPRAIMVPVWELPFRRCKEGSTEGKWEPNSTQVGFAFATIIFCMHSLEKVKPKKGLILHFSFCPLFYGFETLTSGIGLFIYLFH